MELAAPVEEDTTSGTLGLQLVKRNYQLQFDYTFEDFSNSLYDLTWDNPKRTTPQYTGTHYVNGDGSTQGQMAMAPDNKAHMMKVEGGVNLGRTTRLGFEGGYQRWSSFNPMMPYTNNPYINGLAGAPAAAQANTHGLTFDASSLDSRPDPNVQGLIEVYTYMAKLTSRPFDWLRGSLIHEAYIMENGSKKYTVPGWAVFDQNWHAETTPINPTLEQFRDDKTSVKTEYDFASWLSGNTSVSRKYMKKTRAVDKGVEYEVNQGFTIKPAKNLWVNLGYLVSGRRANGWDYQHYPKTVSGGVVYFNESPGLMRPDVADRNRQQGRVQVQWMPGDATVNLSARMTDDKYRGGKNQDLTGGRPEIYPDLFGVLSDRHQSVGLDTSFAVTKNVDADFFYEYDFHRQFVRSSQTDTRTNIFGAGGTDRLMAQRVQDRWDARFTEHTNVIGCGVTHRPTDKMKNNIGVDLTFTRSNGDPMTLGSRNSTMTPLETSRRVRQTLKAGSQYKFTKNLTLAANYVFDRYQANDFAYTDIPTVMGTSSMFLGADPIKTYLFHSLGMSMSYKF
ncbi:MAG: hypothetical protein CO113_19275 [Elusimicrobia bacterium CG_4_9_14_3_um_filter_62_55]|nr:MAG: hypothetical protein COR54_09685 [Elusimicrobia bacterium CG22_combo_CG10-13_8_21_14_all_63_91]PJA11646.1 MAG: hypothetical protein COX66_19275 [Elusimicrobia bacterium CG_4_10_14_0_2_um_filter_63_34]PJB23059.1 MAG: hypothetical protein CO113_19275 [Elusimicrobia bacterium CG_4_9_14_3_um_filter_62_55]